MARMGRLMSSLAHCVFVSPVGTQLCECVVSEQRNNLNESHPFSVGPVSAWTFVLDKRDREPE